MMKVFLILSLISQGNAQMLQWPMFPFVQCSFRFLQMDVDVFNFDDYGNYFNEESVLVLAQTGEYKGLDGVEEYSSLLDSRFNPFYGNSELVDQQFSYMGYDRENDQCLYMGKIVTCDKLDPSTTGNDYENCVLLGAKVHFSFYDRKISRANAFYHQAAFNKRFEEMESDETRAYICDTYNDVCSGIVDPIENCYEEMAKLPLLNDGFADGKSQACRIIHVSLAVTNPEGHCAHVSINPVEDSKGRLKCQQSSNLRVEDLWTEDEIASLDEFAVTHGIEPGIGYIDV